MSYVYAPSMRLIVKICDLSLIYTVRRFCTLRCR